MYIANKNYFESPLGSWNHSSETVIYPQHEPQPLKTVQTGMGSPRCQMVILGTVKSGLLEAVTALVHRKTNVLEETTIRLRRGLSAEHAETEKIKSAVCSRDGIDGRKI